VGKSWSEVPDGSAFEAYCQFVRSIYRSWTYERTCEGKYRSLGPSVNVGMAVRRIKGATCGDGVGVGVIASAEA
jgi:hypothetical protein